MLHTFVSSAVNALPIELPVVAEHSMVSERIGARFISMCMEDNDRPRAKINSTIIKDTGKEVFMYTNNRLTMYAMKTNKGVHTEFCFINSTAVDRCNGWNHWQKHNFTVVYSQGIPYAIVTGYDSPEEYVYFELSKVKWYTVKELVDICTMVN